jgi:hypothetical protein
MPESVFNHNGGLAVHVSQAGSRLAGRFLEGLSQRPSRRALRSVHNVGAMTELIQAGGTDASPRPQGVAEITETVRPRTSSRPGPQNFARPRSFPSYGGDSGILLDKLGFTARMINVVDESGKHTGNRVNGSGRDTVGCGRGATTALKRRTKTQ